MTITLLQITPGEDGHELKARFGPREKALNKRQAMKAIQELLADVLEGLKDGRSAYGGGRGFWSEVRVEEIIVDKTEEDVG